MPELSMDCLTRIVSSYNLFLFKYKLKNDKVSENDVILDI